MNNYRITFIRNRSVQRVFFIAARDGSSAKSRASMEAPKGVKIIVEAV